MCQVTMFAEGLPIVDPAAGTRPGKWKVSLIGVDNHVVVKHSVYEGTGTDTDRSCLELHALLVGFKNLVKPTKLTVCVESQYVNDAIGEHGWLNGCIARGWNTAAGASIRNLYQWQKLFDEIRKHDITWLYDRKLLVDMPDLKPLRLVAVTPITVADPIQVIRQMSDEDLCRVLGLDRFCQLVSKLVPKQKTVIRRAMASPRKAKAA